MQVLNIYYPYSYIRILKLSCPIEITKVMYNKWRKNNRVFFLLLSYTTVELSRDVFNIISVACTVLVQVLQLCFSKIIFIIHIVISILILHTKRYICIYILNTCIYIIVKLHVLKQFMNCRFRHAISVNSDNN